MPSGCSEDQINIYYTYLQHLSWEVLIPFLEFCICYKPTTTNSNNKLDCIGCLIIKQAVYIYATASRFLLWVTLQQCFALKFGAYVWKKHYIPHCYLRMRREPQVINKAFVEIVRFKHWFFYKYFYHKQQGLNPEIKTSFTLGKLFQVNHRPLNRNVIGMNDWGFFK